MQSDVPASAEKFLSTPSARRATWLSSLSARRWRISIHALREEGDRCFFVFAQSFVISIHALREEGDYCFFNKFFFKVISIHALREEGDKDTR